MGRGGIGRFWRKPHPAAAWSGSLARRQAGARKLTLVEPVEGPLEEVRGEADDEETRPRPVALWLWIRGITYPVPCKPPSGTDAFLASVQEGLRQRAAEFYARRYYAAHGRLPEGTHQVQVTVDPAGVDEGGDIQDFFYNRSPRYLEAAITFPPAEAYHVDREPQG